MAEDIRKPERMVRQISLQVPESVNLVEMSNEEIEKLALEMAKKAAGGLPKKSTLLGVEKVVLTNSPNAEVGVWGAWERSCSRPELDREGLVINPEVFRSPVNSEVLTSPSTKTVIQNKPKKPQKRTPTTTSNE